MNADRLLALYDQVAGAPDAVPRLRRFVLDLAVRGRLVAQEAGDEPASALLERIAGEKARLVKAGRFQEPRNAIEIKRDELPFVPPAHWVSARLIDIARPSYGFAFKSSQFNGEKRGMPVIRIRDISKVDTEAYYEGDYDPAYLVQEGDYLVGMDGNFNLRRWAGKDGLLNQRVMRINSWRCEIAPEFVKLPLQMVLDCLHGDTSLTTVKHLSAKQVNGIQIPLPPLAEQHRIVAKVDELMALLDRLEAARTAAEATRDRLTAASLARLTATDSGPDADATDLPHNARFALATLPALTTRPDQIKPLRQTILNLAVRGKLVAQDPTDEPASELLKRLQTAKNNAFYGEGLRKRKAVQRLARSEISFGFPESWALPNFDDLFVIISGVTKGGRVPAEAAVELPYLRVANVQRGHLDLAIIKRIIVKKTDRERYRLKNADILMTEGGDWDKLGRAAIWRNEIEDCIHQNHIFRVRPPSQDISPEWVVVYVNSELGRRFFEDASKQTTNLASINITQLRGCPIPLPPLPEQHRIMAKVDALMALCDRLEAALTTADTTRARLLDALLHEALEPAAASA